MKILWDFTGWTKSSSSTIIAQAVQVVQRYNGALRTEVTLEQSQASYGLPKSKVIFNVGYSLTLGNLALCNASVPSLHAF